jgi:conjugative transfer pilus assembly protein TraH
MKYFRYYQVIIFLSLCLSINFTASAGGLEGFMKFAERGGSMTSVNAGGIIEDQKSGYLTGGSIISRGPRPHQVQPVGVQLPSADFDPCTSSFDLRFGGLSYIKGKEFGNYLKSLAATAPAYLLKMAIKSVNVMSEDVLSDLEAIARDINGMTFDSCEQGKAIAEGMMGKFNAASTQKCMAKSAVRKDSDDLYAATEKCQDDPDRYGEAGDDNELKSMLPDNYNLVWKALSQGEGSSNKGMKELMMSISGSIIGTKSKGIASISALPSLAEKEDLLERYIGKPGIGTSTVKLYVCDEGKKCLKPVIKESKISTDKDSLYAKVQSTLESILHKVVDNKGKLTDEEMALIEFSRIPLISLFEIELALQGEASVASFASTAPFVEVVCYDMVTNFMQKMMISAKSAVDELQTAQLDNTPIDRFNKNVAAVQSLLRDKSYSAMKKLQTIIAVKERLTQQKRVFQLGFSRFADN